MKVAFIGLGIMGSRMASNLLKGGIDLTIYNRTTSKGKQLEERGAKTALTTNKAVAEADLVFSMLGSPEIVLTESCGENGFLKSMKPNSIWVDSSTVGPSDAKRNAKNANFAGVRFLEAPVAGTKQPAESGDLVFFLGGAEEDVEEVSPLLELMGQKHLHIGEPGMGASMKILVNLMLAQSMLAYSEAMKLGQVLGLPEELASTVLLNSPVSAPFLQKVKERLSSDQKEVNFPLKWMQKDLNLVAQSAFESGISLPSSNMAKEMYAMAKEKGLAEADFSEIYNYLQH